tara:strand:- start:1066 stop:2385 length:1320 start_codon:yes stop_codon:yes gene_type:complete
MNLFNKIFSNKKILIYGMGKTGISSYNFLKKKNQIYFYDDNHAVLKKKKIKKFYKNINKINKTHFDYVVVSPGIDINKCNLRDYLKKNLRKIITDLDIFYISRIKNRIITITGTNGKSTTAKLLNSILKSHKYDSRLCGNIGNPILLEKNISEKTIFVIEASSYQIEYSKMFKCNHAIILNISPDHLERHGSIENYVNAKFKLVKNQTNKDFAYINTRNKYLKEKIQKSKIFSKIIDVNIKKIQNFKKKIFNPHFLTLGNQENLSFILAIGRQLKLKNKKIIEVVNKFKGLKYRQEIIYKDDKITVINDSKATSFASSINILKSLKTVYWLVGGESKLGDKFTLKNKECKNIKAYIFGKKNNFFVKQFHNKLSYYCFNNLRNAVKQVLNDLNKNNFKKTILFSPSAASFDNFKNFEERGEYFNYLINKYKFKKILNVDK